MGTPGAASVSALVTLSVLWRVMLVSLALTQGGCASVSYYTQAVSGHLEVMGAARDVLTVIASTPDQDLRLRLEQALAMRAFATTELGLPDNDSYTSYADLQRPFVVWNVVATPALSLQPKTWCFLVVGCLAYRGYYEEASARAQAASLRAAGFDVSVGGVRAYSTLGWFDDPLLNTMLAPPPPYLQGVMFHELAHQQLYADDDSAFNEAFASTVEREGVRRWLARHGSDAAQRRYAGAQLRQGEFLALLARHRQALVKVYSSARTDAQKLAIKAATLARMRTEYAGMAKSWGVDAYRHYFDEGLNNARLAAVATYLEWVPAFAALLRREQGDLTRFYAAAGGLAQLSVSARRGALIQLCGAAACGKL
jgi:predicted aminopeptidase